MGIENAHAAAKTTRALLDLCNEDRDSALTKIVNVAEAWLHYYEPESKQDSLQRHETGTPPPKKFKVWQSTN